LAAGFSLSSLSSEESESDDSFLAAAFVGAALAAGFLSLSDESSLSESLPESESLACFLAG
jgi:hypothetical protein